MNKAQTAQTKNHTATILQKIHMMHDLLQYKAIIQSNRLKKGNNMYLIYDDNSLLK